MKIWKCSCRNLEDESLLQKDKSCLFYIKVQKIILFINLKPRNMEKKRVLKILLAGMGSSGHITAKDILIEEKPDIIVAAHKKELKSGLQQFAEHLIQQDVKEIHALALVLEEYGIRPAIALNAVTIREDDEYDIQQACLGLRFSSKKEYHVPKKIGKICGKPKGKYRK